MQPRYFFPLLVFDNNATLRDHDNQGATLEHTVEMNTLKEALHKQDMDDVTKILGSDDVLSQSELNSALITAISCKSPDEAITQLLAHGAQITDGSVSAAAARGDVVAFEAFLQYDWDINSIEFGHPALSSSDVIQWFFDHGADPNLRGSRNFSVLSSAVHESTSTSILELLIAHGAELDPQALYTSMSPRSRGGGIQIMKFLIDQGIDINAPGIQSKYHYATPLCYAARLGRMDMVSILLDAGADITMEDHGKTAADIAKDNGSMEIFELLSK